jgi:hypothetical protein
MQARYYDPVIGRFYSNDPMGFTGYFATFNRYSYVGNNPYKFTDPTGMNASCVFDDDGLEVCTTIAPKQKRTAHVIDNEIHYRREYSCAQGAYECLMREANVPQEGNEDYFEALNNKSKKDITNTLTAISLATGYGGLYTVSFRLWAISAGASVTNAMITPPPQNASSAALTLLMRPVGMVNETFAIGVSSYKS